MAVKSVAVASEEAGQAAVELEEAREARAAAAAKRVAWVEGAMAVVARVAVVRD